MKEFSAQTGGRYTYADDIINLQELALAISSMFSDCGNFAVSGCEINGTTITPGIVYINGKLRRFAGATGISKWPQYIYESNHSETVSYASGVDKVGRNIYGCAIGSSVPTTPDPLTNAVPQYFTVSNAAGADYDMKYAFFGKHAVLRDYEKGAQNISSSINIVGDMKASGSVVGDNVGLQKGNYKGGISFDDYGAMTIAIQNEIPLTLWHNGLFLGSTSNPMMSIQNAELYVANRIRTNFGIFGPVALGNSGLYADQSNALNINMNAIVASSHYCDTIIGDGLGSAIMEIKGHDKTIQANTPFYIQSMKSQILTLTTGAYVKANPSLLMYSDWNDKNGDNIARIGYDSTADNVFHIHNIIGNVKITGTQAVNLCPAIMENGVLLANKYTLKADFAAAMATKADADNVYSKSDADDKFASKDAGLLQFITKDNGKEVLRSQIGAIAIGALDNYPKISSYLSDMAKTEAEKKKVCENIGAARVGDFQEKLTDTGWIAISGTELYARQIGNQVCIQGKVSAVHTGNKVFTLPNQIDAPRYDVAFHAAMLTDGIWGCVIAGGSKECKATFCNRHGGKVSLSISYMV